MKCSTVGCNEEALPRIEGRGRPPTHCAAHIEDSSRQVLPAEVLRRCAGPGCGEMLTGRPNKRYHEKRCADRAQRAERAMRALAGDPLDFALSRPDDEAAWASVGQGVIRARLAQVEAQVGMLEENPTRPMAGDIGSDGQPTEAFVRGQAAYLDERRHMAEVLRSRLKN